MTFKLFIRTRVVPLHYLPLRPFHWMFELTPTRFYIPFNSSRFCACVLLTALVACPHDVNKSIHSDVLVLVALQE